MKRILIVLMVVAILTSTIFTTTAGAVTVNDEQVENIQVKENVTDQKVTVSGKGTVTIKVIIDGSTKRQVDMDLNSTSTLTIE